MGHEKKDAGICQRKDKPGWWTRVYYNGKDHWHRCDTKSQAKALYQKMKAQIREEQFFPEKFNKVTGGTTVADRIEKYLKDSLNIGKENEVVYGARWIEEYGTRQLANITSDDVREMQAKMKNSGRWADGTINRHLAFFRRVCTLAVQGRIIEHNPVKGVAFLPESEETRFYSLDELEQIEGHMRPTDWTLVAIAFETGLRRGEQFGLRWDKVNLEQRFLTIPISKSGKTRQVMLTEVAVALFRSLDSRGRSEWVFPGSRKTDGPMDIRAFMRRAYYPALKAAGITGANWHTLRHTFASHHVMNKTSLVVVRDLMGHRDYATTERYAHLAPAHVREALEQGSISKRRSQVPGTPSSVPGNKSVPKSVPPSQHPGAQTA